MEITGTLICFGLGVLPIVTTVQVSSLYLVTLPFDFSKLSCGSKPMKKKYSTKFCFQVEAACNAFQFRFRDYTVQLNFWNVHHFQPYKNMEFIGNLLENFMEHY